VVRPSVPVQVLKRRLPFELDRRRRRQNAEFVQNRRQIFRRQKGLDDVGPIEAVDAVGAVNAGLKLSGVQFWEMARLQKITLGWYNYIPRITPMARLRAVQSMVFVDLSIKNTSMHSRC
jgi:hypothetical protein